ncbi:ankyrin repeat-containing domain protein [Trichoderma velutinum]
MGRLLPRYPEMSAQFDQDRKEGRSFDALELFVRHFLREGSVFATFDLEHLHERQILTELHFRDIQSQNRSMSEDLDLLDEAIGEIDERDIKGSNQPCLFMNEPLRAQLRAAIEGRDPIAVDKVLAMDLAFVDTKILCLAIRYYERKVFRLLLKHGARVGVDNIIANLLYRAAKAGLMDAVELLLAYDANKEGGDPCISTTALNGAASGGHLEIVQYLVEKKGANINGNMYMSPLARAIKYRHTHIIDYLLGAGANVLGDKYLILLLQFVRSKQVGLDEILERFRAGMDNDARDRLFSRAVSGGHYEIVRCLVEAGAEVNPDTPHCKASKGFLLCDQEHSSPLAVAASKGYLEIVRCLVAAGAKVNPDTCHRGNLTAKNLRCTWPHYSPLTAAASEGHFEIVCCLVAAGANINPNTWHCSATEGYPLCYQEHSSPLAVAASNGCLEIIRYLVAAGANVNPGTCDRHNSTAKNSRCIRPYYSPLGAATKFNRSEVIQLLYSKGATLLKDENKGNILGELYPSSRSMSVDKSCNKIMHSEVIDVNDCLAVAAIRAQERRTMTRQLLAKVANSCEKLLDASTMQGASAKFIAFVEQVRTPTSIWNSGTRTIRDICGGYMPRSLSDIVSALQAANAMRSVVPSSRLGCSKKEFINDIPRWASLVSPDDQPLFFEIASYLWGKPASKIAHEMTDNFTRPLMFLQDVVNHLVRTSGLFDHGSGNSYRLQTLQQQHLFGMRPILTYKRRLTLAEWHPLLKQAVQERPPTNTPKPPDPGWEELTILARITVLMAGAIFGAILLYLCLSRYGFSTPCLPILASDAGQDWASDQIITRNSVILCMYIGFTSPVGFENWKNTGHLLSRPYPPSLVLPDSPPTERVWEHMAAVQAPYEGDYPMIDPSR